MKSFSIKVDLERSLRNAAIEGIIDIKIYGMIMEEIGFELVDDAIQISSEPMNKLILKNKEDINFLKSLA
jgi:hypothetical protein